MNIRQVLFPTDFSDCNGAALEFAATIAAEAGAVLHIVHVDDMQDLATNMADAGYPYLMPSEMDDRSTIRRQLDQVIPKNTAVHYRHHYLKGTPVGEIVKFAQREGVDLIVMASHGRSGLMRLLLGSIAEGVLRKATCPVLIVKQPAMERSMEDQPDSQLVID